MPPSNETPPLLERHYRERVEKLNAVAVKHRFYGGLNFDFLNKFDFGVSRIFHVADVFMVTVSETCEIEQFSSCVVDKVFFLDFGRY